jgi:outer membrane biogenesis lipoprotein LolB
MVEEMKLSIDGIAYTAAIAENMVTDMLGFQGPIEFLLRRYAEVHPYEAMHLGDINEDISSHLAMSGNTVSLKIEIVVT